MDSARESGPADVLPIAVLGYSIRLPQGINSGEDLFTAVREKRQLIAHRDESGYPLPAVCDDGTEGVGKYRPLRGNYTTWQEVMGVDHRLLRISSTSKDSRFMAVTQVLCLEAVWKALEDAGLRAEDVYKTRTGIFVGACEYLEDYSEAPDDTNPRGILSSSLADRIGFCLGTHGPSITMDTACSGSLTALSTAAAYLRRGDCDTALVLTVSVGYVLALQASGVLGESGYSNPVDGQAEGLGRDEGLGCVVLRRMDDAERDGQQVVATLVNATAGAAGPVEEAKEAAGRNYEATCAASISRLMIMCYEQARVPLEHVRYIEAHAAGTRAGDIIELQAIARAFRHNHDIRTNPLRVGSVEGNIGHAEAAAGVFSFIKALEMVRHRTFLPARGLHKPRTDFDWRANNVTPCVEAEPFPEDVPTYIGVNSFDLGGGYAHAILCPYIPSSSRRLSLRPQPLSYELVPLTAMSEDHLAAYEDEVAAFLTAHPHVNLLDVAGTFAAHRSALRYRRYYVASSVQDLIYQLRAEGKPSAACVDGGPCISNGVAMVFTGQGSQWLGCGDELLSLPVYRRTVAAIDSLFLQHAGWSPREKQASLTVEQLAETQYAQPVTFMVQVALFETLKSLGVAPAVVMGHSAGEVAAAYASGLLTLDEAVGVVYHRSQEQQRLAGCGRMLAIGMDAPTTSDLLSAHSTVLQGVEIACINSPRSVVLAGPAEALARLTDLLPQGCFHTLIPGSTAFHCKLTEPILQRLTKRLAKIMPSSSAWKSRHASVPFISTVTGKLHDGRLDAKYWVDNVRYAVRFQDAVEMLCRLDPRPSLVLELGPHRTLVGPLLESAGACAPDLPLTVLPTLKRQTNDVLALFTCLSQLMAQGYPVRLPGFCAQRGFSRLRALPGQCLVQRSVAVGGKANSHGPTLGLRHMSSSNPLLAYHAEVLPFEHGPPTAKVRSVEDGKEDEEERTGARQGTATTTEVIAIPLTDLANVRSIFDDEEAPALEQGQESGEGEQGSFASDTCSIASLQTESVTSNEDSRCLSFKLPSLSAMKAKRIARIEANIARSISRPPSMDLHEAQSFLTMLHQNSDAPKRLIAIPPPGAGGDLFGALSIGCAEIFGVLIPGRPGTSNPKTVRSIETLGSKIATAIERLGLLEGRPLSLLGQSAGASLAFEVAMNLKLLYGYTPEALFVVSMGPPQNVWPVGPICWQYNTGLFLYLAGASKGLWRGADKAACVVRDMRDSSAWAWRQMHRTRLHGERLDCPILVCDGEKDWITRGYPIRTGWARYTNAEHSYHQFPGRHRFLFGLSTLPPFCRFLEEKMGGQTDVIQPSQ